MKRLFLCAFLGTLCGTGMYAQEQGNKAEFVVSEDSKTLTIKGQGDLTALSGFTTDLTNKIKEGQFETVTFENEGATPLYINEAIIKSIMFLNPYNIWGDVNTTITTLDLGQATCKDLKNASIFNDMMHPQSNVFTQSLTLTFPLSENNKLELKAFDYLNNTLISKVIVPEGYTAIGDKALYNWKMLTDVSFPSTLDSIGAEAFMGCIKLTSANLNEGLTYIGKDAFNQLNLTEVVFPSTLDKIDNGAFYKNLNLKNIQLRDGLRYIGDAAFAWDSQANLNLGTLKIPSTVKYIGPAAFEMHTYGDIYFTSTVAPLMPIGKPTPYWDANMGAFSANMYYGDNGFEQNAADGDTRDEAQHTGFANRENYKNNGRYFGIIHYPNGLTDEQKSTYTQLDRKYVTIPDSLTWTSTYNNNTNSEWQYKIGQETSNLSYDELSCSPYVAYGYKDTYVYGDYIWPSQQQWSRAYVTAGNGLNYDGVTPYRTALTEEELAILKEAGYDTSDSNLDNLQKIAHFGTRLFVLTNGDATKGEDYPIPMKGGQWWTLCVPFHMTLKQVKETFGDDTQVCIFSGVDRKFQVEEDGGKTTNGITLKFQVDATRNNVQKSGDGTWTNTDEVVNDNDIVIYAHESYMIHPSATPEDAVFVVKNYQPIEGAPQPTIVESDDRVQTQAADEGELYRFIGNYNTESTIPQYSYVFGKRAQDAAYKFWFYTGNTLSWSANKSIVEVADHNGGANDYDAFFNIETGQQTKQVSLFGDDKEVTAIETPNVTIKAGKDADAPIYSIDGRLVSSNGDTANLAKGIYVQAGKKFVVK